MICVCKGKGCFAGVHRGRDALLEHTGEGMLCYSKHMKRPVMKEYKYDPVDSGREALSLSLVCSTSQFFPKDSIGFPYTVLLISTSGDAREK